MPTRPRRHPGRSPAVVLVPWTLLALPALARADRVTVAGTDRNSLAAPVGLSLVF